MAYHEDINVLLGKLDLCEETIERLWDALSWLDTYNPEDIASIETKWNIDIRNRCIK